MKYLSSLVLLFALSVTGLTAQEQSIPKNKIKEVGVNMTYLVNAIFSDASPSIETLSPYYLTYKIIDLDKRVAFRTGIGADFSSEKNQDAGRTDSNFNFDFRFGWESHRPIIKNWTYTYGIDFLVGYSTFNTKSDFANTAFSTFKAGLGPEVGIQFKINEVVSLYTEMTFYYRHSVIRDKTKFNDSNREDVEKSNKNDARFILPTNIFLTFNF